jgi:hypothetical protein
MVEDDYRTWFQEKVFPIAKALGIAAAFLPWLILAYSVIAPYMVTRDVKDQQAVQGFIEWFGTAYSFFLALAIVNVWSQFDTVEREFDRELDAVSTLLQNVKHTEASSIWKVREVRRFKESVQADIKNYVDHVVKYYKFEHRVTRQYHNGDQILERIGKRISLLAANKAVIEPFIYELFDSLNEAMDVRGDRISHSKPYTPWIIKLVAVISSIVWQLSFLGLVIYDKWVAGILLGGVTFVIVMVLIIFYDLGEPFGGIWRISLENWDQFLYNLDHASDPEVIFIYDLKNTVTGQFRSWFRVDICHLDTLARSGLGLPWNEFLTNLRKPRTNGLTDIEIHIRCSPVYSSDLKEKGLKITCIERPLVVLECKEGQFVLLSSREINECENLAQFEEVFHRRMKEHLLWYQG